MCQLTKNVAILGDSVKVPEKSAAKSGEVAGKFRWPPALKENPDVILMCKKWKWGPGRGRLAISTNFGW